MEIKAGTVKIFNPKYDETKLDWSLLPIEQIEEVVKVLDYGKQKYSANAWQGVENAEQRYLSATYRHLVEYQKGNKVDEESGLSHLSHLATNILFLMWFEKNKVKYEDDEYIEYCKTALESHKNLE